MSGMGLHKGVPGRHHRRALPHFTSVDASRRIERKSRWWRKAQLSPAEIRERERRSAARRAALLALVSPGVRREDGRLGLEALAALLDQDERMAA